MATPTSLAPVAVIGNGLIGHGVARVFAAAGVSVRLVGRDRASLDRASPGIRESLRRFADHGLVEAPAIARILARLQPTTALDDASARPGRGGHPRGPGPEAGHLRAARPDLPVPGRARVVERPARESPGRTRPASRPARASTTGDAASHATRVGQSRSSRPPGKRPTTTGSGFVASPHSPKRPGRSATRWCQTSPPVAALGVEERFGHLRCVGP